MSEPPKARAIRDERLRAALRENLKRRRAQARTRDQAPRPSEEETEDDSND
ncbi:MAG: hypothetical protein ABSG76_27360 [Xanthobacteraceae bacterium]